MLFNATTSATESTPKTQIDPIMSTFVSAVLALPEDGSGIVSMTESVLERETELRHLFAQMPRHRLLDDPFVGLLDLFAAPEVLRRSKSRIPGLRGVINDDDFHSLYLRNGRGERSPNNLEQQLFSRHIFALPPSRRRESGSPCTVSDFDTFLKHWDTFTLGLLRSLDWANVIAAGGAVQACLQPEQSTASGSFYHEGQVYSKSDVDLFLWGLDSNKATLKIKEIFYAIKAAIPWDTICIRKKNVVSIHSRFPFRTVQIVLRLYTSPAEILTGFDIDCACVGFDGQKVIVNPRSVLAMMTQCNTVDITRRSPTYEIRLRKYADRGFEVFVPSLNRSRINPEIFVYRPTAFPRGLARLLILEDMRTSVRDVDKYPLLTGASTSMTSERKKTIANLLDTSDYDPAIFSIPYGPEWNAQRIENYCIGLTAKFRTYGLVRQVKESGNVDTENFQWDSDPKAHRHIFQFSRSIEGCMEEVCRDASCRQQLERSEADLYLPPGPIRFISSNPGRQLLSGSFQPIDDDQWEEDAYFVRGTSQAV